MAAYVQQIRAIALPFVPRRTNSNVEAVRPSHRTLPWDCNRIHLLPSPGSLLGAPRTRVCPLPHHPLPAFRSAPKKWHIPGYRAPRDLLCLWGYPLRRTRPRECEGFSGCERLPHHHADTVATVPVLLRPPGNNLDAMAFLTRPARHGIGCAVPHENTAPPAFCYDFRCMHTCFSAPERHGKEEETAVGHHSNHQRHTHHQPPPSLRLVRGILRLHGEDSLLLLAPPKRTIDESVWHAVPP